MKLQLSLFALPLSILFISFSITQTAAADSATPAYRDIYPDTWVAADALGRTMPGLSEAGPVKTGQRRVVGIFYITWHNKHTKSFNSTYTSDVTKILQADPEARLSAEHPSWKYHSYHSCEPESGYFLSKDKYVIRKDISMLSDAGVDVLVMDVTNAWLYLEEWDVLFSEMQKMKEEGNKVPLFCFWSFNGPSISVVQALYEKIYTTEKYKDLWFYWDGKPLLLYNSYPYMDANRSGIRHPNSHYDPEAKTNPEHPHYKDRKYTREFYTKYTKEVRDYFTLRNMWWGFYKWAGAPFIGTEDNWSFGYNLGDSRVSAMKPEDRISRHKGKKEQAAVTTAQHSATLIGRSWTREHGEPELNKYDLPEEAYVPWLGKTVKNPEGYGIYFQDRWEEALSSDPQFIYINDWNEWTAGMYKPKKRYNQTSFDFMRRVSNFHFIDQYNSEFNRAIQPMKGGYTDNYYMQMAQNIRRYKGVRSIPELRGFSRIDIDGQFNDWKDVKTEYRDTIGDTIHRDFPGYGSLQYKNASGRNDIVAGKVAFDANNTYFFAQTRAPLTHHNDNNWMLLLIDADNNHLTGWHGYDYLVNKNVKDNKLTTLKQYNKVSDKWEHKTDIPYRYNENMIELAIPNESIQLSGNSIVFDFHWADNPPDLKTPISLCTDGDSAPNRRFNYRCIWKK